jgi:peptidoglycan/LPS O-acetylase OafA/YrhL
VPPIRATYDATIGLGSTASLSLELVAALVAAAATFHFVEAPARNAMRRAWRRQMRTSALAS